jgi:hypothetical protein
MALNREKKAKPKTKDEIRVEDAQKQMPPLSRILNVRDMEVCHYFPFTCPPWVRKVSLRF